MTTAGQHGPTEMTIELTPEQVDEVVSAVSDAGSISISRPRINAVRETLAAEPQRLRETQISRSLLIGLLILASFPPDRRYLGLVELARALDMNPGTIHRYVSTLVSVGLVQRDPATRRYRLAQ